jgi:hypothetical protein
MATTKQTEAAKQNIKKAQEKWRGMSHRQHALAQPQGRGRAKPGSTGHGSYFHIEVRPKSQFTSFRNQDVGGPGGLERVAGRRRSGSWATHAWLISKEMAHMEGDRLVADHEDAKQLLSKLRTKPVHKKGDIFTAHDRRNVPEREKPTEAQRRAWAENIKKAQAARRKTS